MRWRGALVYYLAGVLSVSVLVALAFYLPSAASWRAGEGLGVGFLLVFRLALVSAVPAALLYAFTLRRVSIALRRDRPYQWLLLGTALGLAIPWLLASVGFAVETTYFPAEWQPVKPALVFPFIGPIMYQTLPVWVRLLVAAASALVLHAIHVRTRGRDERR